jgi:hypothetical protein
MAPVSRWQDWTSFVLALWLALSPWLAGYAHHDAATGNAAFCGLALALASHFEASCCEDSGEWINLALGAWLLAAPFALGFAGANVMALNTIGVGILVIGLAASMLELGKDVSRWIERFRAQH